VFEQELEYFVEHQDELVAKHAGKFLILRGREVVGAFDTALDAYLHGQSHFPPGSYMIQPCEPGPSAYTVTIAASDP
jgi:hypothetical protein